MTENIKSKRSATENTNIAGYYESIEISNKSDIGFPTAAPSSLSATKGSDAAMSVTPLADGEVTLYAPICLPEFRFSLSNSTQGKGVSTPQHHSGDNSSETIKLAFRAGDNISISIHNGYGYSSASASLTWKYMN